MTRRLALLALLLGLGGALAGCITPSIPIPPPDPTQMEFTVEAAGASFRYPPNANYAEAIVSVYNRDRGLGVIEAARADGSVGPTAPIPATLGDQIVVSFERDDQTVSTCIRLREGNQSPTDYCQ